MDIDKKTTDCKTEIQQLQSEIQQLKFQIQLLTNISPFSHYLLECNVTKDELSNIFKILDKYRTLIDGQKKVNKSDFENEILSLFNKSDKDYHFCICLTKLLAEEKRYEEIYNTFYSSK